MLVVLTMLFHLFPLRWCLLLLGNAFLAQRFIFHCKYYKVLNYLLLVCVCVCVSSEVVLCDNRYCGLCAVFGKLYRRLSLRRRALVRSASLDDFVDLRENSHLLLTASKKELLSRSLQVLQLVQILTLL